MSSVCLTLPPHSPNTDALTEKLRDLERQTITELLNDILVYGPQSLEFVTCPARQPSTMDIIDGKDCAQWPLTYIGHEGGRNIA